MTIESRKLFSMAAQIGRGMRKSDSHLVTDAESSETWDKIAAEHAAGKKAGLGMEIPFDPE